MELSLDITGAVGRIGGTDEQTVVEADWRRHRIGERLLRSGIRISEGESGGGVAPSAPKLKPLFRFFNSGNVAGGNPPHCHVRRSGFFEPLQTIAQWDNVAALINESLQCFDRFPYRHIDVDARVFIGQDRGGIARLGLQSPDKPWAAVR